MTGISAPIFRFSDGPQLTTHDSHTRLPDIDGLLAMTGPSVSTDPGCLPVRGDLAHIKLAGLYFVPHYAVPMPHRISHLIWLRSAADVSADELCEVPVGTTFNVLDIVGGWAWGQIEDEGPVGYLPMSNLEAL